MSRQKSKHLVKVFDPNRDPSVIERLKAEQKADPTVVSIEPLGRWGMIETSSGTYFLTDEGVGSAKPDTSLAIDFYRHQQEANGGKTFEVIPFARATFSLAEIKACATGEVVSLDQFIRSFGSRLEANFEAWEKALS
jgi:hypothetical protein